MRVDRGDCLRHIFCDQGNSAFWSSKLEAITQVEITDMRLGGETRVFTEPEKIELARKLLNF